MATSSIGSRKNVCEKISELTTDPVSHAIMDKAVCIVPCGHSFSESIVIDLIGKDKLCPIDRQAIERYIPNYTVRDVVELVNLHNQEESQKASVKEKSKGDFDDEKRKLT